MFLSICKNKKLESIENTFAQTGSTNLSIDIRCQNHACNGVERIFDKTDFSLSQGIRERPDKSTRSNLEMAEHVFCRLSSILFVLQHSVLFCFASGRRRYICLPFPMQLVYWLFIVVRIYRRHFGTKRDYNIAGQPEEPIFPTAPVICTLVTRWKEWPIILCFPREKLR